jgi:hypothetical protein
MIQRLLLPLMLFILVGCTYRHKDKAYYTRDAYEKQQLQSLTTQTTLVDQKNPSELLLDLSDELQEEWQRIPWETIDDWMERIQNQLVLNSTRIRQLQSEQSKITGKERDVVQELQVVLAANEEMRHMMSNLQPMEGVAKADAEIFEILPPPSFQLHFVQKGDTLYSLSNYYYDDPEMIHDIMLWNQGWLRDPHQLVAGLALVLFNDQAPEKNEQVVENYISRIPAYQ